MIETVAIVGVGLIGGSFALALRKAGFAGRILGISSSGALKIALERGMIDEGLPLEEALPQADLVYLAQPIHRILKTLEGIDPLLKSGALVTDAGSTKGAIVRKASQTITRSMFLGGHPMAGKEQSGVEHASADLFSGRLYVLTPTYPGQMEEPLVSCFCGWLQKMGARLLVLDPEQHDAFVSATSHLPQLASSALAVTVRQLLPDASEQWPVGPGLLDTTRLALSPFHVWGDIFETNQREIARAVRAYLRTLEQVLQQLEEEPAELASLFARANRAAQELRQRPESTEG